MIPLAHSEQGPGQEEFDSGCSLDYDEGPGMGGWGPFGETSGGSTPIAVENFHMLAARQPTDTLAAPGDKAQRVNLLNWDGKGAPEGMFPPKPDESPALHDPAGGGAGLARRAGAQAVSPRLRLPAAEPAAGQLAVVRQAASLLLGYPDEELLGRLPLLRAAVAPLPAEFAGPLGRFLDHLETTPLTEQQAGVRRDLRPAPPVLRCTSPTTPTATPGSAAWRCCSSSTCTAAPG